jgi:hypothetical protein
MAQLRRLSEEELSFICTKLGERIEDLNYDIKHEVSSMLNVAVNGKDFQNLASYCELNHYKIMNLQRKENPMEDIFTLMISQTKSLKTFLIEMYKISRGDVVQILFEIANKTK